MEKLCHLRPIINIIVINTQKKAPVSYSKSVQLIIEPDGSQTWVRFRDGIINEGGSNKKPRLWDRDTGFNNNPFKKGGDKKNPPRGTNNNDANDGKGPKNNGGNDK